MGSSTKVSPEGEPKKIRGTKEWAVAEFNCSLGCPHNCRYCYARYDGVGRQKKIRDDQWENCRPLQQHELRKIEHYDGQIMFPTAHDIVPENLSDVLRMLRQLLAEGNKVLIVSKPHLQCIRTLCSTFVAEKEQLLFRFTITARDDQILQYWEPGAPGYRERFDSLIHAYEQGFATSVSVEPILDSSDVIDMVQELLPFITHSIWLGKMNKISERVRCESETDRRAIAQIRSEQRDEVLIEMYHQLEGIEKVRWKESIKEVVGLDPASEPGLDI